MVNRMKPLVIYHANCTDGFGAAFAAWLKLGDEAEYLPMEYGRSVGANLPMFDGREVYILDFSFSKPDMEDIFAEAKRVVWLDHHASVMKEWGEGSVPAGVEVRLSNEHIAYVDPDDLDKVKVLSWSEHVKGGAVAYNPSQGVNVYMHHLILPKKEGFVIDHINRDTLDNRRCNLRYANRSQNGANGVWNEARYKGVTRRGKGFKAQITVNYENIVIGTYPTEEEAARAYDEAARQHWGMFARTNFDHREPFPPNAHVVLDNNKSGAMLAWEYFHPGTEVPMLIQHIDDRDRWQFKMEGSRELHAVLASLKPWGSEQWDAILAETSYRANDGTGIDSFYDDETVLLRAHSQQVQSALKQARPCEIWSFKPFANAPGSVINGFIRYSLNGLAANAPAFLASDLGHELANRSGTFGLVWSMAGDGQIHCALRSNGDYDVSAIAKAFGGGGHRNAAGFSVEMSALLEWLK